MPLWVFEGMSDYMTGYWRPLDIMTVRDAAVADIVPKMSEMEDYGGFSNPRLIYNLGHAAFEFMESKWGKEGVRAVRLRAAQARSSAAATTRIRKRSRSRRTNGTSSSIAT